MCPPFACECVGGVVVQVVVVDVDYDHRARVGGYFDRRDIARHHFYLLYLFGFDVSIE